MHGEKQLLGKSRVVHKSKRRETRKQFEERVLAEIAGARQRALAVLGVVEPAPEHPEPAEAVSEPHRPTKPRGTGSPYKGASPTAHRRRAGNCRGCGCALDDRTSGCAGCTNRHRKRRRATHRLSTGLSTTA